MRLSPESEQIVAATAGVVAQHAEQITGAFYPDMFAAHPELMRVFNKANQAIGEQPQALAASVVAFAVQLIDPDAPDFTPVMQRIAHKHVSLGIGATQYTIVGHHLLKAVKTVLGDAITPEIAAAHGNPLLPTGERLADARSRLDNQVRTCFHRLGDGARHLSLLGPRLERAGQGSRDRALRGKELPDVG